MCTSGTLDNNEGWVLSLDPKIYDFSVMATIVHIAQLEREGTAWHLLFQFRLLSTMATANQ